MSLYFLMITHELNISIFDCSGPDDIGIKKLGVTNAKEVKDEDWKKVLDPTTYAVCI